MRSAFQLLLHFAINAPGNLKRTTINVCPLFAENLLLYIMKVIAYSAGAHFDCKNLSEYTLAERSNIQLHNAISCLA